MSMKMRKTTRPQRARHRASPPPSPSTRSLPSRIFAVGLSATLGVSGVAVGIAPASAQPGYAESSAQYLSGTLLGVSLDEVAEVEGVQAVSEYGDETETVEANNLDLSVLDDTITLEAPGGIQVPLDVADLGVLGQYAQSSPDGDSFAATGLVASDGTVGVAPDETAPPGPATVTLSNLIADEDLESLDLLSLQLGAVTASASQDAPDEATGDYEIAGLQVELGSPVLEALNEDLLLAASELDSDVEALVSTEGTLLEDLVETLGVVGVVSEDSTASLEVDLESVVDEVLSENVVLGEEGPVTVDLSTGVITADIAALLEADGQDINELEPGTELLSEEVLGLITSEVDELVNALLDEVTDTLTTALEAAELTIDLEVLPALGELPLLSLTLDGTLAEIAAGDVTADVSIGDVVGVDVAVVGLAEGLLDLNLDTPTLLEPVTDLYPLLGEVLPELISLTANNQETAEGTFTETALRLSLLEILDEDGEVLTLNVGTASVGPNALVDDPQDPDAPVITEVDPTSGPEEGGTEVTITGENLTDVGRVEFGEEPGTDLVVDSDTQVRITTPGGTGTVPVAIYLTDATEPVVAEQEFTYVPADTEAPVVTEFTPTSGPENGGTIVTIIGENLEDVDEVLFGTTPATGITIISDTEIEVITPAGSGDVPVVVEGVTADELFTYTPVDTEAPVVNDITPNTGPEEGGTDVVLDGENLEGVTEVRFGESSATSLSVVSDAQIQATTPPGTGVVDVVLVSPEYPQGVSTTNFTYENTEPDYLYETCADAAAAGAAPLYAGDPGYRGALDADNDGIACEEYAQDDDGGDDNAGGDNNNGNNTGNTTDGRSALIFQNCTDARAAGVAPMALGDYGYHADLDQDNDGIACEDGTGNGARDKLADTGAGGVKLAIGVTGLLLLVGSAISGLNLARSRM